MNGVDVLRDKYGNRLGEIQIDGSKQVLVDSYFVRLGSYDAHDNLTPDKYGNVVGRGNILVSLLRQELASSRCWQNLRRVGQVQENLVMIQDICTSVKPTHVGWSALPPRSRCDRAT